MAFPYTNKDDVIFYLLVKFGDRHTRSRYTMYLQLDEEGNTDWTGGDYWMVVSVYTIQNLKDDTICKQLKKNVKDYKRENSWQQPSFVSTRL